MIDQRPDEPSSEADVMPVVERPPANLPTGFLVLGIAVAAILLFGVLESRRSKLNAPATSAPARVQAESAPPPLYIPPEPRSVAPVAPEGFGSTGAVAPRLSPPSSQALAPRAEPSLFQPSPPMSAIQSSPPPPVEVPQAVRSVAGNVVVFDRGGETQGTSGSQGAVGARAQDQLVGQGAVRARAGMFANRATTVPQGTLIPAILETGFDSTRPGSARALVQRDIRGFDGSRVLIPRGSRLIGEYQSDVAAGQNRALILWTRLIRPDGGTVAVASPVTDTQGRTGAKAHVNTHFLAQFSNAILQTSLNIGTALAARGSDGEVFVALPGAVQSTSSAAPPATEVKPTLTVSPGTSISVLVSRDLDFIDVENQP